MKLKGLYVASILLTAVIGAIFPAMVRADESKIATGWLYDASEVKFVTFPFTNPIECREVTKFSLPQFYQIDHPVRVGNYYYYYTFAQQMYGYDAGGFYRFDIEDNSTKQIADYGGKMNGMAFSNLNYDYTDGTMYCTYGFMDGGSLATLDTETGTPKKTCRLKVPLDFNYPTYPDYIVTLGINYDGEMYGLTYWGHIVKVNKFTGDCKVISNMDYNPDTAFMYMGNRMFFDNETGDCYIQIYTYSGGYEILKVDLASGHCEQVSPTKSTIYGIYLPYTAAEPSAPAKVTSLSVTPAEKGVCQATLSWTNPSKTFGRGGTLEDLSKLEIYRNGELIHAIENPVIGGEQSYVDTPEKPEYYTYRVVGYNSAGRGDRACASAYIGMGIPQTPQNVTVKAVGDSVEVAWTMPKYGEFGAYIDYTDVVYDVYRVEGQTQFIETLVAEGIKDTQFVDSPDHLGRFFYNIKARSSIGASDGSQSEPLVCGPAIRVPYTYPLNTVNDVHTWTILDGNGDFLNWQMTQRGVMNSRYDSSYGYAAMEYLISPKTLLQKDKRYKITFQAQPGSDKVAEVLAVSFGNRPTPEAQDSVTQFNIISKRPVNLRANLPVVKEDGLYHFGFVHRTAVANYNLSLSNISIAEDHEGYASVSVVDSDGKKINGATVTAPGVDPAKANDNGSYILNYLPQGEHTITVSAPGYYDATANVSITEWETTPVSVTLEARPKHTLTGVVIDAVGDPVKEAKVSLSGYAEYTAVTDAQGRFTLCDIYDATQYCIGVTKNRHKGYNTIVDITNDLDMGTITLADNLRAPRKVEVSLDSEVANVAWARPANDIMNMRYDDGGGTQYIGYTNGTAQSVFGSVFRTPSTVSSAQYYIGSLPDVTHWSVQLYIFDLDENGNPSNNILYMDTYVPCEDDQWNTYTLPTPVEAPNGFYLAISTYGNICIGVDGAGDNSVYPFVEGVNYFSPDYTTGEFYTIEEAGIRSNFMLRAWASPYDDKDIKFAPRFIQSSPESPKLYGGSPLEVNPIQTPTVEPTPVKKVLEERLRYDVYRVNDGSEQDKSTWTKVAENVKGESFSDESWASVEQGIYKYAVAAIYADQTPSEATFSNLLGRNMHTDLSFNVFTNTEKNLAAGAKLTMQSSDGRFCYEGVADENGRISLAHIWKGIYTIYIDKEGFDTWMTQTQIGDMPEYTFAVTLHETKYTPYGLQAVDDGYTDGRTLTWNNPELYKDSFEEREGHPVFTINSPGKLGWHYRDGDQAPTGGLNYTWPGQFEPMAWMTFNPDKTNPSMLADGLMPMAMDGSQFLIAVSSGEVANDDWIISPRLFFSEPFSMQFYAAGWNPLISSEEIEVGYTTTGSENDYTWFTPFSLYAQYWTQFTVDFPAEAKHVAIRYATKGKQMVMLDNIKIGNADHIMYDNWGCYEPSYKVPVGKGLYEIFVNGTLHATTDKNLFELRNLANGHYVVGVRSKYSSGYSDMVSTEFDITQSGMDNISSGDISVRLDGRTLTIEGADSVKLVSVYGIDIPLTGNGTYDLSDISVGVYVLTASNGSERCVQKLVIK